MDNRNTVIALILMFLVWIGFTFFFPSQPPRTVTVPAVEIAPILATAPSPTAVTALDVAELPPLVNKQREVVVETDLYRAVFTNSGARLLSFSLKKYHTANDTTSPLVRVIDAVSAQQGTLRLVGRDAFLVGADNLYSIQDDHAGLQLTGPSQGVLVFRTSTAAGLLIEKIYRFVGDKYAFTLETRLVNRSAVPLHGSLLVTLIHPWSDKMSGVTTEFVGPMTLSADKLHTDKVSNLEKEAKSYDHDLVWSGFTNKYFLGSLVPLGEPNTKVQIKKVQNMVENIFETPAVTLAPGASQQYQFLAFFGPLQMDVLKADGHQLERAIDFGFFSLLAKPLFHVLVFFYSFLGNYGWSIILLTTIIKLLFWPLTQKSYTSMKSMQKLQPEMQKLRERFKNDRERMNREIMELYKTHRVNPVGGCLPMVIQIPVFFALYKTLMISIELRHAPFIFWLTDLSAKDPYYITPLVMGATMFIQQKMTPMTTVDPIQAKIFLFMPIVFTFLFLNFPSGLVIYWMVNNLLTILQQYLINRSK